MKVTYYTTEAGRSQPVDFLRELDRKLAAQIAADITALAEYGDRAPIQTRAIGGARPMVEIKTGGYRTFFVRVSESIVVLHICKKQDQKRGIEVAAKRMKEVLGG